MKISDQDFLKLVQYMLDNYGIDLSKKRTLIESRLSIPVKKMGFDSFSTFVDYAISDNSGKAVNLLTTKLTTNYTFFMREKEHFDFLKESVLPYLENKLEDKDIRIWSAGCSSGEEAYSIAMTIDEYFGAEKFFWDAKVLATDISSTMLSAAIKGVYDESRLEKMPEEWKRKYFKKLDEETYEIKENIKNEVIFRLFNLQDEFPFKRKFHVIFCRNVMIYFNREARISLVSRFYDHLEKGGYLFIGHSESLNGISEDFKYVKPAIYRKI
ncbi:MAG TPA: protein-glutamate O-methyltransferase CheR [Clostridiaceae bacterium]|jgi:chemotaxis protein methyltransferase CheR|nr:protein-glutamate O-methyltransferase CheR [Clostridiaceae bacterium]